MSEIDDAMREYDEAIAEYEESLDYQREAEYMLSKVRARIAAINNELRGLA